VGKFESVNDVTVAHELFNYAITETKSLTKNFMIGPMDGSTWDAYRYPVFSPNPLILTENVYKDYYPDFFQQAGFKSIGQYLTQLDRSLFIDQNKKEKVNNFLAPLNWSTGILILMIMETN